MYNIFNKCKYQGLLVFIYLYVWTDGISIILWLLLLGYAQHLSLHSRGLEIDPSFLNLILLFHCSAPSSFEYQFKKDLPLLYKYFQEAPVGTVWFMMTNTVFVQGLHYLKSLVNPSLECTKLIDMIVIATNSWFNAILSIKAEFNSDCLNFP